MSKRRPRVNVTYRVEPSVREEVADALATIASERAAGFATFLHDLGLSPVAESLAARAFSSVGAYEGPAWENWAEAEARVRTGWLDEMFPRLADSCGLSLLTLREYAMIEESVASAGLATTAVADLENAPPMTLAEALADDAPAPDPLDDADQLEEDDYDDGLPEMSPESELPEAS